MIYWKPQPGGQAKFFRVPYSIFEVLLHGPRAGGKACANDNEILTNSGWKYVSDVTMQDKLVAVDGTYTDILGIFPQGEKDIYRVTFDDGAKLDVCLEHRWGVFDRWGKYWVKTTKEMMDGRRYYIPTCKPAPGAKYEGLDPYIAGLILGDGTTRSQSCVAVYSPDEFIQDYLENAGWSKRVYAGKPRAVVTGPIHREWKSFLGEHKGADKKIPQQLLLADPDTRLATLQGLLDTDGSCDKQGRVRFTSISYDLAHGVQYLARSLGLKSSVSFVHKPSTKGGRDHYYEVRIIYSNKLPLFRLPRKLERLSTRTTGQRRAIRSIDFLKKTEATCFAVAHPSKLFVCQDFVVTHNTDCLIMDFCREVGQGFGPEWTGLLLKRTNPELEDVKAKIRKWIPQLFPGTRIVNSPYFTVIFPDGERLMLRHMRTMEDYWSVHGSNYSWIGWEELSNWPTPVLYLKVNSLIRSSHPEVSRRKRLRATTNPGGAGHNWIKERFELPAKDCVPISGSDTALAKKWMDGEHIELDRLRMAVRMDIRDNRVFMEADPGYLDSLKQDAGSESQYRAWVYGDWDIVSGGMFDDVWDRSVHWIPPFKIPHSWLINRSFDWGESKPFSVGWWAESDGTDVRLANGKWASTVRGDLFRIGEWYGWNGQPNEGSKLVSSDIAIGIIERELGLGIYDRCVAGPADTNIFSGYDGKLSIADEMAKPVRLSNGKMYRGVTWTPARKGPGSRETGWSLVRKALKNSKRRDNLPREQPGLFIFDTCEHFSRTFPVLPRDEKKPDDVDSEAEDHIADETRYRVIEVGTGARTTRQK